MSLRDPDNLIEAWMNLLTPETCQEKDQRIRSINDDLYYERRTNSDLNTLIRRLKNNMKDQLVEEVKRYTSLKPHYNGFERCKAVSFAASSNAQQIIEALWWKDIVPKSVYPTPDGGIDIIVDDDEEYPHSYLNLEFTCWNNGDIDCSKSIGPRFEKKFAKNKITVAQFKQIADKLLERQKGQY